MSHDELVRAARELIDAASEPIKYPANSEHDEVVLVPANLLWLLREALDPQYQPPLRPESDWFRGDGGELIEVRYLDIPGLPSGEIDEIVCGPMHLETTDVNRAYITLAGLMVNIVAMSGRRLSITCEPDACTRLDTTPTSQLQREAR